MASRDVKAIVDGAIIVASDLLSGRAVYYTTKGSWSKRLIDADVLNNLEEAHEQLDRLLDDIAVVDPYLVATNASGHPKHIREAIRTSGPTIENVLTRINATGESRVPVR